MSRSLLLSIAPLTGFLLACTASAAERADSSSAAATDTTSPAGAVQPARAADLPIVRGLYVNRFAAQSMRRMRQLIAIADSTEINAFVIDVKDEFGLDRKSVV